jgi:Fe-S oxidoreductase
MGEGSLEAPTRHALQWQVGRPVARQALQNGKPFLSTECPLAGMHIRQAMEMLNPSGALPDRAVHPIELIARAYGLVRDASAGKAGSNE